MLRQRHRYAKVWGGCSSHANSLWALVCFLGHQETIAKAFRETSSLAVQTSFGSLLSCSYGKDQLRYDRRWGQLPADRRSEAETQKLGASHVKYVHKSLLMCIYIYI